MTYSLNTLNASAAAKSPPRTGAARFGHEIGLVLGLLALVFWLLALLDVYGRVAHALIEQAHTNVQGQQIIENKISRQDLAKTIGAIALTQER